MRYSGLLIRRERLRRNWSQAGLCRGICAVSYLSKIEQGKAAVSDDVLHALLSRLGLPWYDGAEDVALGSALCEAGYDALLAMEFSKLAQIMDQAAGMRERLENGPFAPDLLLLGSYVADVPRPLDQALEPCLHDRQLALQRVLQNRYEEALRLYPCGYISMLYGNSAYERGENAVALERLSAAYQMAADAGQVRLMLLCRLLMGNCYSNLKDVASMSAHYRVAERMAEALGDADSIRTIRYNTASTQMETGGYDTAYRYFSALEEPDRMSLHKLAICCEKLGRREDALAALDRAAAAEASALPDMDALTGDMCSIVRYRLEHAEYLHAQEYGALLLSVFRQCREKLPVGYAAFHLPWVLQWLTANRQYKQAYELLSELPEKTI